MSTYKFSDAVATMWPFPPAVIKASATAAWPFPKSPPEEAGLSFASVEARIRELQDEEADNQEVDLNGGLSAVNEIEVVSPTQEARDVGVQFCHVTDQLGPAFGFKGVSIAYRRCGRWRNSKMVEVAVVYCSQHDTFNKKTGSSMAAQKFLNGNTIVIPARCSKDDDSVVSNLKELFWYCLADMH